ncbi:cation-transporting P-type ATPase [Pectobacterium parmentieri]|uniref:cation-transporting P-type ATPase n=1 Tax=Pectobacterium parmentieri TaxID=1905730 RepID=UPI001F088B29|nr:cation-transporting P-type ATPase [Pectobacterium parmentieri]
MTDMITQTGHRRARKTSTATFAIAREAQNSLDQTLANLNTHLHGLSHDDVIERQQTYGENRVAHEKAPHALVQLASAFNNPFIYVLMALAAISFFTDYWLPLRSHEETSLTGVVIILVMVSLSGLLRFWQEFAPIRPQKR